MKYLIFIMFFFLPILHSVCQNQLDPFDRNRKPFKENNKFGYKDEKGNVLVSPKYDKVGFFQHGLASVTLNDQVALIDQKGKIVVPFGTYDIIDSYREGMVRVLKEKKYGFLDITGKEKIPCSFDEADFFRNGLSTVRKTNKEGIINSSGEEIIPIIYDKLIQMQSDKLIKVELNGYWGYIDYSGRTFIKPEYDELDQPSYGMIMAKKAGRFGYFNSQGELAIPFKYERATPFTESGKASIVLDGEKGVVSKDGTEQFPE